MYEESEVVYVDDNATHINELSSTLTCPICLQVLNQPVELACGALMCADCCCRWLQVSDRLDCPCCYGHQLSEDNIMSPTPIVLDLLSTMKLRCFNCGRVTTRKEYAAHRKSKCTAHYTPESPSGLSVKQLLETSTKPTQLVERRVASNIVRRMLAESSVVRLPTGGQVYLL